MVHISNLGFKSMVSSSRASSLISAIYFPSPGSLSNAPDLILQIAFMAVVIKSLGLRRPNIYLKI
jgi:hypothetical protein